MIRRCRWCSSKSSSISPRVKNGPTSRPHAGPLAKALSELRSAASQASGPSSITAVRPIIRTGATGP